MIQKFGPFVKTLRFEAKHSYFKSVYHCTNNRKNEIKCQTLAKRHQFMMFLHYSKQTLLEYKYSLRSRVQEVALELVDAEKKKLKRKLAIEDSDLLCEMSSVKLFGQRYHLGNVLLLDFVEDEYVFGIVGSIFSYNGTFYFYVEKNISKGFQFHFNSFELINSGNCYI